MQAKDTISSTFDQLFLPVLKKEFQHKLKELEVDKYAKKLDAISFIELMAFAQMEQQNGLRDISNNLNKPEFKESVDLDSISASQLSRKLRDFPPEALRSLFKLVKYEAGKAIGFEKTAQELMHVTRIIDSSTISLCLSHYPWASFRKTKSGIKLHLRLRIFEQGVLPDDCTITPARFHDRTQMGNLVVEEADALNVFDRGYVDYKKFDSYCKKGIRFITRLKSNAIVELVKDITNPGSSIKDRIVYLGNEGISRMKNPLRLLETEDSKGNPVLIVTNDFELESEEISEIYRNRWQIELFFKWIKQHLKIKHFFGLSRQAVENQILIALITYSLMLLLQLKTGHHGPLLVIHRLLRTCLFQPFSYFVRSLHQKPQRTSRGRRRSNYEAIYQETVRQVMAGEADHLDDLTYDPIIL